jgi:hypothetical protein
VATCQPGGYAEHGRRKSPPSADDNRTTGSDDGRMSDQLTVTPVVLEPATQAFADATADPPYLFELGLVEGRQTFDEVQKGEIDKPNVDIEDTTARDDTSRPWRC